MKRPLTIVAIALLTALVIYACGSTIRTADTSLVTITIGDGQKTAALRAEKATPWSRLLYFLADAKLTPKAYAAIPAVVKVVIVTVSAPDMTTMVTVVPVEGLTDIAITLEVPNGMGRNFLVEGFDASSTVVYRGQVSADLKGDPVSLTINLDNVAGDTIPPTFSGLALVANTTYTSMLLSWSTATDNMTPSANIVYLIYQSETPGGEAYAAPSYTTAPNATSYQVNGLTPGATYYFVVRARDAAGNVDSNTVERSQAQPGFHVATTGDDTTGDGSITSPFKTITKALSVTPGNEGIFVSLGTYDTASGETFPLHLKPGTILACLGTNYSTVLDDTGTTGANGTTPMIFGEQDVFIDGCMIVATSQSYGMAGPAYWTSAIDDGGFTMSVNNTYVDGGATSGCMYSDGIYLSANSSVKNSTVTGFPGCEGNGKGITVAADAVVSGSTISGNNYGIYISAGNSIISNNTITGNYEGIYISTGTPTISYNTIIASYDGIYINTGDPSISHNTITANNGNGIYLYIGNPSIANNTITGSSYGLNIYDGAPTIDKNTITTNNGNYGIYTANGPSLNPTITNNALSGNIYGLYLIQSAGTISGNTINNNGYGIYAQLVGSSSIHNNKLSCNTAVDFYLGDPNSNGFDISNNAWDHDASTLVTGPTITSDLSGCPAGEDICYFYMLTAPPVSSPSNTAVAGGCL